MRVVACQASCYRSQKDIALRFQLSKNASKNETLLMIDFTYKAERKLTLNHYSLSGFLENATQVYEVHPNLHVPKRIPKQKRQPKPLTYSQQQQHRKPAAYVCLAARHS
jgi:hypothetical protein